MDNLPKVSVIIPSFNRFEFLLEAINSVQRQDYSNFEIIIINDGSTEKEYYNYIFPDNVSLINLEKIKKRFMDLVLDLLEILELQKLLESI